MGIKTKMETLQAQVNEVADIILKNDYGVRLAYNVITQFYDTHEVPATLENFFFNVNYRIHVLCEMEG